jgi:rhodanese-related sulfurtransferase
MKKYLLLGITLFVIILIVAVVLMPTGSSQISSLDSQTFSKDLSSKDYILLDIRTIDEFNAGHIKGAKEIDYYQTQVFSDYLETLDKSKKYLIYCHTGRRTGLALEIFKQKGFKNVSDLAGGFNAWLAAGLPTEK